MEIVRWWRSAIFEDSAPYRMDKEIDAFPVDWRESIANFDTMNERLSELMTMQLTHGQDGTWKAHLGEVTRLFHREMVRSEEFFRFKRDQIRDKLVFIKYTYERVHAREELTHHVEGVLVANLAGLLAQIDFARDFASLHRRRFQSLLSQANSFPALNEELPKLLVTILILHWSE